MENLKKNILPNFRKINNNLKINTNEHCSEINIKTENNKIIDGNDKQKEFASISKLSKIDDIDERYKSLNNKNVLNTNNRHNKLMLSIERKYTINNDIKSYNLYNINGNNGIKKSNDFRRRKYLLTEKPKFYRKKIIDLRNKEILNQFLPILKKHN